MRTGRAVRVTCPSCGARAALTMERCASCGRALAAGELVTRAARPRSRLQLGVGALMLLSVPIALVFSAFRGNPVLGGSALYLLGYAWVRVASALCRREAKGKSAASDKVDTALVGSFADILAFIIVVIWAFVALLFVFMQLLDLFIGPEGAGGVYMLALLFGFVLACAGLWILVPVVVLRGLAWMSKLSPGNRALRRAARLAQSFAWSSDDSRRRGSDGRLLSSSGGTGC